jgi:hypothetical protein
MKHSSYIDKLKNFSANYKNPTSLSDSLKLSQLNYFVLIISFILNHSID